jgi:hypothetical protein
LATWSSENRVVARIAATTNRSFSIKNRIFDGQALSIKQTSQLLVPYHPSVNKHTMGKIKKYFPQAQFAIELN